MFQSIEPHHISQLPKKQQNKAIMQQRLSWRSTGGPPLSQSPPILAKVILCCLIVSSIVLDVAVFAEADSDINARLEIRPANQLYIDPANPRSKEIRCILEGANPDLVSEIRWSGPNSRDNFEVLKRRASVNIRGKDRVSLRFNEFNQEDVGTYYCTSNYQSTKPLSSSIQLDIASKIKITNCPSRQFIVKGAKNNVSCKIEGDDLAVEYSKDGEQLRLSSNIGFEDGNIQFKNDVNESDAGTYTISAISGRTGDREEINIAVEFRSIPEFSNHTSQFYGVEEAEAMLDCPATGKPQPFIYWLDPRLRNVTEVGGYIADPIKGTLRIDKVNKADHSGFFRCIANNGVGQIQKETKMVVDTRPRITAFENKTIDEFGEVVFECRSTGDPMPEFTIRRAGDRQIPYQRGDGYFIDSSTIPEGADSTVYVHRLRIRATRAQFGLHYCNATNRAGSHESLNQLFVRFKPDLSKTPAEQYIHPKLSPKITCIVSAYPAPLITWKADNQPLVRPISDIQVTENGLSHLITISPHNDRSSATYTCMANNVIGYDERIITPRYKQRPGVVSVNSHDSTPTTIKLFLSAYDGGDKLKGYRYIAVGKPLDLSAGKYSDVKNDTLLDGPPAIPLIIRNLIPDYRYTITISAFNEIDSGDSINFVIDTKKPSRPDPPIIQRLVTANTSVHASNGVESEYNNGFLVRWAPPGLDNGSPIQKYIVKYYLADTETTEVYPNVIELPKDRPTYIRVGPLVSDRKYRVQVIAQNAYGESDPAEIIVYAPAGRPTMPEFDTSALAWVPEVNALQLWFVIGIIGLILTDFIFCVWCDIGFMHHVRGWFSPKNTNLIADKPVTDQTD